MNQKENILKREKTKKNITDAFMRLYASRDIFNITIRDITDDAGLHRSTFYQYFDSIDDVLSGIEGKLLLEASTLSKNIYIHKKTEYKELIDTYVRLLTYYREYKEYFVPLMGPTGDPGFVYKLKKIIYSDMKNWIEKNNLTFRINQDYVISHIVASHLEILYRWLKFDDIDIQDVAAIFSEMQWYSPFLSKK